MRGAAGGGDGAGGDASQAVCGDGTASPGQLCFEETFTTYDVALSDAVDIETLSCNDDIGRDVAILGKSGASTVMGLLPSDSGGLVADMDLDGDLDVATINVDDGRSAPSVTLLQNDGLGSLSMAASFPRVVSGTPAILRVDDFNDDGVPDLVILRAKGSSTAVDVLLSRP